MPNAAPSSYIIEGKGFGQNSLIFPMIIDYEPLPNKQDAFPNESLLLPEAGET